MKKQITNKELKRRIVEVSYKLGLSHIGSCLTAVDIIKEIYDQMKGKDRFILSSGHAHLAHIVIDEEINKHDPTSDRFWAEDTIKHWGIHCDRQAGCDVSTGSLGHGIGIAVGMALACRGDNARDIYCLISDGEMAEGSVYEALRIKRENNLDNLKVFVNDNGWGAYRRTAFNYRYDDKTFQVRKTNMLDYPEYLQGQLAHYKVLDKDEYKEVMKILQ